MLTKTSRKRSTSMITLLTGSFLDTTIKETQKFLINEEPSKTLESDKLVQIISERTATMRVKAQQEAAQLKPRLLDDDVGLKVEPDEDSDDPPPKRLRQAKAPTPSASPKAKPKAKAKEPLPNIVSFGKKAAPQPKPTPIVKAEVHTEVVELDSDSENSRDEEANNVTEISSESPEPKKRKLAKLSQQIAKKLKRDKPKTKLSSVVEKTRSQSHKLPDLSQNELFTEPKRDPTAKKTWGARIVRDK